MTLPWIWTCPLLLGMLTRLQTCTRLLSTPPLHTQPTLGSTGPAPWVGVRESRNLILILHITTCVVLHPHATTGRANAENLSDARHTWLRTLCTVCAQCTAIRLCTTLCNKTRLQGSCPPLCREPRAASHPRIPAPPPRACSDQVK